MTTLHFAGTVTRGDECRVSYDAEDGSVLIGDRDVVDEALGAFPAGTDVTVAVADSRWSGPLEGEMGYGCSEFTPMDSDSLTVGPHDVVELLLALEGQHVDVWIADEPLDLGATP